MSEKAILTYQFHLDGFKFLGKTNLVELWGFGLISLGVGRALRILEGGGRP